MSEAPKSLRPERVAILPLRNSVLFPMSVVPINVGRPRSVRLVEEIEASGGLLGVVAQRDPQVLEPGFDDLFSVGTLARVVKVIRLTPTSYSVVLNGIARFHLSEALGLEPYMRAYVIRSSEIAPEGERLEALASGLREKTRKALSLMPDLPKETAGILDNVKEPGALADLIASNFPEELAGVLVRQKVLEALDIEVRVQLVSKMLDRQLQTLQVKAEVQHLVETEMSKTQRQYVLRKHLRAIREELGENPDDDDEVEKLRERLSLSEVPEEVRDAARKQLSRLAGMQPQSSEYQLSRNYVEWLLDLPWSHVTPDNLEIKQVKSCLEQDHHGLLPVKKRIVEYSAMRKLRKDNRGPILLFLGPPGVGKTSLGRSIARAMGRRYARIALGGVRDEAEIRGHRRTYVGALPGRIIQALKKVGTRNPVLVLDEIDKMGADMRGDPAAALLEVLDPAQNDSFVDHYLGIPFDLSKVTFLATANYFRGIPEALADRMEVIEVPGYTPREKQQIARRFLIPKQLGEHGITPERLVFEEEGVDCLIESYTREAGVRNLERNIASVCRDLALKMAEGKDLGTVHVTRSLVEELLGPHRYLPESTEQQMAPGIAVGFGASGAGGELLLVEANRMPGKGNVRVTGSLGPVLLEAAHTAVSFVRSRSEKLHLQADFLKETDLHLHIPRARSVVDFAGIGLTIFCAVSSLLLGCSCRSDVAVLGELTLRGNVLPVEEVQAMLLAAHRAGIKEVILPAKNEPDVAELPEDVRADLRLRYVARVDEVLPYVLLAPAQGTSEEATPSPSDAVL